MNQLSLRRPLLRLTAPSATADGTVLVTRLREAHLTTVFDFARRRLPTRDDAEDATAETFAAAFVSLARCPTPEAHALRTEDRRQLQRAVLALTPDQRDALLLKYVEGLTMPEIGAVLGKSESAVNSLIHRARTAVFARAAYHFLPEEPTP